MKEFSPAGRRVKLTTGQSLRLTRELQDLDQDALARLSSLPVWKIAAIERDEAELDLAEARLLARALHCHPAVLAFPTWDAKDEERLAS